MSKAFRVPTPMHTSPASSQKSDGHPLVSIALFSGIGLLVSLIAMIVGVLGAWH